MPDELRFCFFCNRTLSMGSVAGVICDSPFCQRDLVGLLRMFNEKHVLSGRRHQEKIPCIFSRDDINERNARDLVTARNEITGLLESLECEFIANPKGSRNMADSVRAKRIAIEDIFVPAGDGH